MRIAHNPGITTALNYLSRKDKSTNGSLEKLSSGRRINRAADDVARFGMSERMRTSIRSMGQALKNIEDGVNLLNTAESGLAQVTDMLQRMRELALQSATGTLADEQRKYLQVEHSQLLEQADKLAVTTEFNGHKVLSPLREQTAVSANAVDIVFVVDRTGSMGGPIGNVQENLTSFVDTMKASGLNVRLGLVTYGESNAQEPITNAPLTDDVDAIRSQIGAILPDGGGDTYESALEGIMDPTTGAITANFRNGARRHIILVTDAPTHDNNEGDGGDGLSALDIDDVAQDLRSRGIKTTVVSHTGNEYESQYKRLTDPTGGTYLDIAGSFREQLEQVAGQIAKDAGVTRTEEPTLQLLVGVRPTDTVSIKLFDARVRNLGLQDTAVDPREKALEALGRVDAALTKVLSARSEYGAHAEALEHAKVQATQSTVTLTEAESRIADVDMAFEMAKLTKDQLLIQTATAMIAQGKMSADMVLRLVKGGA